MNNTFGGINVSGSHQPMPMGLGMSMVAPMQNNAIVVKAFDKGGLQAI